MNNMLILENSIVGFFYKSSGNSPSVRVGMRAVSCIFHSYFNIIKNETKKISPYCMQNSISHCLDSPIPKKETGQAELEF